MITTNNEPTNPTIYSLRKQGFKIRCLHQRYYTPNGDLKQVRWFKENSLQKHMSSKGGMSILQVTTPDGREIEVQSNCSKKDGFSRKKALKICIGRLMKKLEENKGNENQ